MVTMTTETANGMADTRLCGPVTEETGSNDILFEGFYTM